MKHTHVFLDPALFAEPLDALPGLVATADHAGVVGDGDHEGTCVEVALLGAGVHLERRPARARVVHAHAVVDDAFEDR